MASKLYVTNPAGGTMYGVLQNRKTGKVLKGTVYETPDESNRSSYAIELTRAGDGDLYIVDVPAAVGSATEWICMFYTQVGASPDSDDPKMSDELTGVGYELTVPSSPVSLTGTLADVLVIIEDLSGMKNLILNGAPVGTRVYHFLNRAQKMLDQVVDNPKTNSKWYKDLSSGERLVEVPGLRILKNVWTGDSDSKYSLTKIDFDEYMLMYPGKGPSLTVGDPLYFAIPTAELAPDQYTDTEDDMDDGEYYADTVFGVHFGKKSIILGPPSDGTHRLTVDGAFFSKQLSATTDVTYWTHQRPSMLAYAVMYYIRISYNDIQGSHSWLQAIQEEVALVTSDVGIEESVDGGYLEG